MSIFNLMSDYAKCIRPGIGRDSQLGQTQTFDVTNGATLLFSNKPCSYQEASSRIVNYYAQRNITVSNEILFGCEVACEANDLLVVTRCKSNTTVYVIVAGLVEPVEYGSQWVWKVAGERIRQPS